MSLVRRLFQYSICLICALAFATAVRTQTSSTRSGALQPERPKLVAVDWPDLTKLEPDVREQLVASQNLLAATLKDPAKSNLQLAEAYGNLGEIYQAYSLNAAARECYANANRLAPKDFRWIYLLARLDQQEGRVDEAIRSYRIAGSLRSDYVAVPMNLGNIYLELHRLQDAAASFAAALAIQENTPSAYYGLGQVALSLRNYPQAIEHFKKALALAPDANRIHYSLAMAYRGVKDLEKAKAHLAQQGTVGVRVADPLAERLQILATGERVHLIRGRQALEAKRYAEAAREFRSALAAKPDSIPAHMNLGAALTQIGDLPGAAEQFAETLRIDPNHTGAHYNLAVLLANENKHQEAIVHLQTVCRINPNDLGARFLLAQELNISKRMDEALAEFSRIVQADPNNEDALIEQVKILHGKKQNKEALVALESGHERHPQKQRTALMLAYLLAASPQYDLRDGARALKLAQPIYELTQSLEHGTLVSLALAELGRCSEAAAWQRKMIAVAERQGIELSKLRADLQRYEKGVCRPGVDIR